MEKENMLTPNLVNRTEMKQVAVSDDCLLQRKFTTSVTSALILP